MSSSLLGLRKRLAAFWEPLSRLETLIGLATGVASVIGALFGFSEFFSGPPQDTGQVVAIVRDAETQKAVSGARIEILTGESTILTTMTTNWFGRASHRLAEGQYRVRVDHPKFRAEVRQVQVVSGQTSELDVPLRAGSGALRKAGRMIDEGVSAIRRLFED